MMFTLLCARTLCTIRPTDDCMRVCACVLCAYLSVRLYTWLCARACPHCEVCLLS